jgi:hypothetical protein
MRIMGHALAGMALAVTGMLVVGVADPTSAAARTKGPKDCRGTHQALQNGECVSTTFVNPDRVTQPCNGSNCYRSSRKHKKTN